jgi:catechol 2,3-dioxygenase-like lactoylglutathione lyase family enzyme
VPKLARIAPELPVSDLPRSVAYYANKLGFRVVMEMPDRRYAVVERDDVAIHLFEDNSAGRSPVSIHIFSDGLEELHSEFVRRGALLSQAIVRKPWGNRDFRVLDDSGNEIKFTEPLSGPE